MRLSDVPRPADAISTDTVVAEALPVNAAFELVFGYHGSKPTDDEEDDETSLEEDLTTAVELLQTATYFTAFFLNRFGDMLSEKSAEKMTEKLEEMTDFLGNFDDSDDADGLELNDVVEGL